MNRIIEELQLIATLLSGKQREAYDEMIRDAKAVEVVPLSEVFTAQEIEMIKRIIKPKRHECYKNAFQLTMLFSDRVKYCEGKTTVGKLIGIEHAWNKVDDKYVDITMELVLGHDMSDHNEDYAAFGEWGAEELLDISQRMEFYGGVYEFSKSEKQRKVDALVDNAVRDLQIHQETDKKELYEKGIQISRDKSGCGEV